MSILMNYFVPMVPDSAPIVIPVNQYDYDDPSYAGRLVFNMIYNGVAYDLTGATASIQGTKPDGKAFAYDCTVDGSAVRARLTQQMTAVYGRTTASVIILDADDNRIGSFAVWLEVQQSALDGSAPASETEIPTLIGLATAQAQAAQTSATQAASYANAAAAWSANPPYIGLNGNWYVYNKDTGLYEDSDVNAVGRYGNLWYSGTAVSGKSSTPTPFATGIAYAHVGDMYLNWSEGAIYECTTAGDASTALWKYGMTLTGGGGGGDLADLHDVSLGTLADNDLLVYDINAGKWENSDILSNYYTKTEIDAQEKAMVTYGGAVTFATLPALIAANVNKFYLVTDSFTTTADFVVGAGHVMPADSHIAIINVGTDQSPTYKYDDFGGWVDTGALQPKTLETPITIRGTQVTTVEGALGRFNSQLDSWGTAVTLAVGQTTQSFTGLEATGAYEPWIECASGYEPPALESQVATGTTLVVTFSAVTSDQDGSGGECKIRLRRIM